MRAFLRRLPIAFALAVLAVSISSVPLRAQLGKTLEEVRGDDFWTFFNLKPIDGSPGGPEGTAAFRPAAGPFAPLVRVTAALDASGRIRAMELTLSREFVDDPANGIFARDIAKSFLRAAMPADDIVDVETLANEIEHPRETPGYTVMRTKPAPDLPRNPTPGYEVYLGTSESWSRTLEGSTLRLRNQSGEAGRVLVISVEAR